MPKDYPEKLEKDKNLRKATERVKKKLELSSL